MLVIGSRHDAPQGQVGIAVHARQLIDRLPCPLLIAPRGYSEAPHPPSRIGVAIDGGQESAQALEVAARLAAATGAELVACGAVSDRPPAFGWSTVSSSRTHETWTHALDARCDALTVRIEEMTEPLRGEVSIEVERGRPAEVLRAFSGRVDLLVIGSRRWGPLARLVLGGTGEALANGSRCPLLLTPRPASGRDAHDRHD